MPRFRRIALALIGTAALCLPLATLAAFPATAGSGAGAARAEPTPIPSLLLCFSGQPVEGFQRAATYWDCDRCLRAGDAGIARGDWQQFRCPGRPVGLDYEYDLYVR
jgi:hypothetical protein